MKVHIQLEQEDLDHMHDVIFEVIDREPTNEEIQRVWEELPDHIKGIATQWGTSDSVFRDNMYEWLSENLKIVNLP
jgi:hypothetical protein